MCVIETRASTRIMAAASTGSARATSRLASPCPVEIGQQYTLNVPIGVKIKGYFENGGLYDVVRSEYASGEKVWRALVASSGIGAKRRRSSHGAAIWVQASFLGPAQAPGSPSGALGALETALLKQKPLVVEFTGTREEMQAQVRLHQHRPPLHVPCPDCWRRRNFLLFFYSVEIT